MRAKHRWIRLETLANQIPKYIFFESSRQDFSLLSINNCRRKIYQKGVVHYVNFRTETRRKCQRHSYFHMGNRGEDSLNSAGTFEEEAE